VTRYPHTGLSSSVGRGPHVPRRTATLPFEAPHEWRTARRTNRLSDPMGNRNRQASKEEIAHARQIIREAFPDYEPVFDGHGDYGGHRALRDHTISFRLCDGQGRFRSNVIWLVPEYLSRLTVADVRELVARR